MLIDQMTTLFIEQEKDALSLVREKSWKRFLELGLPERKGAFQYLPLSKLYLEKFIEQSQNLDQCSILSHVLPSCRHSYLVFIGGALRLDLSDFSALANCLIIQNLDSAIFPYGTFLNNRFKKSLKEENDPFVHLNLALHNKGLFLYVPPKTLIESPIQCLFLSQGISAPRLQLFVGKEAKMNLIMTHIDEPMSFFNGVIDLALDEGATLTLKKKSHLLKSWHFDFLRATLKRDSHFRSISLIDGGQLTRQDASISLVGEGAEAEMKGLWTLGDRSQAHTHIIMDHQAPHTRSFQQFKGVLELLSQSSFEGKILVRQAAQKTEAYQSNQNLLLGEHAIANSKPNLEIFADDVKASHGATVSQLDPSALFYLKTRGLSENEAKTLLVDAFCQEIRQAYESF